MKKPKKPVASPVPNTVENWDNEGGAPPMGDRSTAKKPKRPRDVSQLAKMMVDIASGEGPSAQSVASKSNRKHVGGTIGGRARAKALAPEDRTEIARTAALARWKKTP